MKLRNGYLILFLSTCLLSAEDTAAPVDPADVFIKSIQEQEVDFIDAYDAAREAGVSDATLLSGKTLYYLMRGDMEGLIKLSDDLEAAKGEMEYGPEAVFAAEAQLIGLVRSLDAVVAYREEQVGDFEAAVKESFWLWPQWAGMMGLDQMVLAMRSEEIREGQLKGLTIPMDTQVRSLDGTPVALSTIVDGKKALLVDFWASWCGPCIRLMPELKKKADVLGPQGIYVAGLNTDDEDPLTKEAGTKEAHGMDMPWLVEDEAQTMSSLLMITSIPHMALIAPDGRLLWSGHPMDDGLEAALAGLGVTLE
jgi:thiol-disulfide isomerase/thioredoxin